MTKGRVEAFSDGVVAIIITIMVLEFKTPATAGLAALRHLLPTLSAYLLSFVLVAIYWNNHHHMLHAAKRIDGAVLWANHHLLFWLSLVPFAMKWMDQTSFGPLPVAVFGFIQIMSAIAYFVLTRCLVRVNGKDSDFAHRIGGDAKGRLSVVIYLVGVACALSMPWLAITLYAVVALIWLVPDRRFAVHMGDSPETE